MDENYDKDSLECKSIDSSAFDFALDKNQYEIVDILMRELSLQEAIKEVGTLTPTATKKKNIDFS